MNILITGATGLVGSFVARKFLENGYKVKAIKRPNADLSLLKDIHTQIEWIEGDVLDISVLEDAIQPEDIIIHAAAVVSFTPKDVKDMFKINIEGTANVVNTALKKQVAKLVHVSSIAAIGRKKGLDILTEENKWEESAENTTYAKTKYLSELEVWRGIMEGLNAVIVNPSLILGPGDVNKSSTQLFKYIQKGGKFYTKGSVNYVDVRDVANIIFQLAISPIQAERFILNAGTIAYKDLFDMIATAWQKPKPSIQVSPWLTQIAYRIEAFRSWLTGSKPFITKEIAQVAQKTYVFDAQKVKDALQYDFHTLQDSIEWTCKELDK